MQQLYVGGDILTMEKDRPEAQAVLVEDGVIRRVGPRDTLEAEAAPEAERIDLEGQTLMPAFLDPHSHLTAFAVTLRCADLTGAADLADIRRRLEAFRDRKGLKDTDWLIGVGYDHNTLAERRHPDRQALDGVHTGPVLISHASGHMGVANTRALALFGVTADTPDPDGGRIGRGTDGQPNGYLEEIAFMQYSALAPAPSPQELERLVDEAQRVYARYGIATVQEGLLKEPECVLLRRLAESGKLRLDVVGYADIKHCPDLLRDQADLTGAYVGGFRLGGYKLFLDGSPQGRTAWLSAPYEHAPDGYRGYPIYRDEEVRAFVRKALDEGQQLLTHCNGDAAAAQLLDAFEAEAGGRDCHRPVMIHAQTVRRDQLDRMARLQMIPSFFVAHTYFWGDIHLQNLGRERAAAISPARSAQERGLPFTFHQDTPVIPPDMLMTVWCAVNRLTRAGVLLGEEERVTPLAALKAVTIHAAYQYGEESCKGSIRAGKRADFVVLDRNPLRVDPLEIRHIVVRRTIRAGQTLYESAK